MSKTSKIVNIAVASTFVAAIAATIIIFMRSSQDCRLENENLKIKIDSLEKSIRRWELYSINIRATLEGRTPVQIDSLLNSYENINEADEPENK